MDFVVIFHAIVLSFVSFSHSLFACLLLRLFALWSVGTGATADVTGCCDNVIRLPTLDANAVGELGGVPMTSSTLWAVVTSGFETGLSES